LAQEAKCSSNPSGAAPSLHRSRAAMRRGASAPTTLVSLALLFLAMRSGWPTDLPLGGRLVALMVAHLGAPQPVPGCVRRGCGQSPPQDMSAFLGVQGLMPPRAFGCSGRRALAREQLQIAGGPCDCGSEKQTRYGLPGDERATRCSICKTEGMMNFAQWTCSFMRKALFGHPGDPRPSCCSTCKAPGMIDLMNRQCPCGRRCFFGLKTDARASCCARCKSPGMVNINYPRCACGANAELGPASTLLATHCRDCQLGDMVKMRHLKCTTCGIRNRLPAFGLPEDAEPSVCSFCKTEGMINFKKLRQLDEVVAERVSASLTSRKGR